MSPERDRKQPPEKIHGTPNSDDWTCLCGNAPERDGFYPIDETVNEVEPTPEDWTTDCYACVDCGRVIDSETCEVVRRIDPSEFVRLDAVDEPDLGGGLEL